MQYNCNLCNKEFNKKFNLDRHLESNMICFDKKLLNKQIDELKNTKILSNKIDISGTSNTANIDNSNTNNININVAIQINPISKLSLDHVHSDKMKTLFETYDKGDRSSSNLNTLLKNYIKEVICDKTHPENQSVKYIKKKPPTYNSTIEKDGSTVTVINGLKDTCDLLSDPVLDILKKKLSEFIKKTKNYKIDDNNSYRDWYGDTIKSLRNELTKSAVKKALSSVLQYDILNDIEMKLIITENTNQI
jgi:hypothetical protein